uniref:Serine/threonine-protein kinase cst-1 n=1 Tax=Schistosoma japonicum TaxID=6182 RepID=C1LDQ2_SCHJA|nr:SARAH,domain-containing protein [Schistosoma japonicum]
MQRLDDSELSKPPSEVLEIICKLGKGSYGSVYKARYKANGGIVAVKKVPVDSDLADIVKEISIMQQCDSPFIVKCYGSLFDSQDLWICMEYCGAGSIADIMRLRGKPIGEEEIATVLHYSLCGLDYLHQMRKIHRDIKAGNILLLNSGAAKLADFGVAGQLSDTLAKRNTVIGTPYWMAPEVIQEIGYNCSADIWSLGITAIEMADGKPPLADIHPMRALFMIPSQPAPALRKPSNWSLEFRAFIAACLAKSPEARPTAAALLQTEFIRNAKPCSILLQLISEANEAREKRLLQQQQSSTHVASPDTPISDVKRRHSVMNKNDENHVKSKQNQLSQVDADDNLHTMVRSNSICTRDMNNNINRNNNKESGLDIDGAATLVSICSNEDGTGRLLDGDGNDDDDENGSFIRHHDETNANNLDTMVVNDAESEEDDSGSVVVHDTADGLDDPERDQREAFELLDAALPPPAPSEGTLTRRIDKAIKLENNVRSELQPEGIINDMNMAGGIGGGHAPPFVQRPFAPFSRAVQQSGLYPNGLSNEPGALSRLSYGELEQLLISLTNDLETELRNLAVRYRHKRQPLLDAIAEKTAQASMKTNNINNDTMPPKPSPISQC